MVEYDEALKGAPDEKRSRAHFSMLGEAPDYARFKKNLEEAFFSVAEQVQKPEVRQRLLEYVRGPEFQVQIPMWNEEDTIGPIVEFLVSQVGAKQILAMDADSTDNSVAVVERYGVRVVRQSDMFKCVKREPFLKILNDEKPRGRGMTLFAFWLYRFLVADEKPPRYACFCDSDIKNFPQYDPMPYLAYPLAMDTARQFSIVKTAKFGRNNETVMGARSAVRVLGRLGQHYFESLARDMWMLAGEYVVETRYMKKMPHMTRSFVDTLTAMYFADLEGKTTRRMGFVSNPNTRLDKKNDPLKEQTILYSIATNIIAYARYGKPVPALTVKDIKALNTRVLNGLTIYPWIPEDTSPMQASHIVNDRAIPSVAHLVEEELIDRDRVREMRNKYFGTRAAGSK